VPALQHAELHRAEVDDLGVEAQPALVRVEGGRSRQPAVDRGRAQLVAGHVLGGAAEVQRVVQRREASGSSVAPIASMLWV
jgi:hypothetical protein